MEYFVLNAYEFACTAAPAFIAYLVFARAGRGGRRPSGASSVVLAAVSSVYLFALMHFTGAGTLHDAMRFGFDASPHQTSWIPLVSFFDDIGERALNVLLFAPLGLLAPMVSGVRFGTLTAAVMAAATSAAIEVSQLLNSRITDVDDLLMNVLGAVLGYGVFMLIASREKGGSCDGPGIGLPVSMIAAAFFARFLLYDEMGLAKVLFGF